MKSKAAPVRRPQFLLSSCSLQAKQAPKVDPLSRSVWSSRPFCRASNQFPPRHNVRFFWLVSFFLLPFPPFVCFPSSLSPYRSPPRATNQQERKAHRSQWDTSRRNAPHHRHDIGHVASDALGQRQLGKRAGQQLTGRVSGQRNTGPSL